MTDTPMMRIGAVAGIVGAIMFAAANMLHPRSDDIDIYAE
jgi:energy-converting hydrogenase Eha subunit A